MRHVVAGALAIVFSTSIAAAESDVAFVNICRDGALGSAAIDRIRTPVLDHSGLAGIGAGPLRASLEQPLQGAAGADLTEAEKLRSAAWDAFSAFSHGRALELLKSAYESLGDAAMTDDVKATWFALALLEGQVHLQAKRKAAAAQAFRLAGRFSPRSKLDPGHYDPDTIRAYEKAVGATIDKNTLAVTAAVEGAAVWVDGHERGKSPYESELELGTHVVTVTAPGYAPQTQVTSLAKGNKGRLVVSLRGLEGGDKIPSLRSGLAANATPAAISSLAKAAGVAWLVLVRQNDRDGLEAAVYDTGAATLGAWTDLRTIDPLLGQLPKRAPDVSARRAAELVEAQREPPTVTGWTDQPWYKTTTGATVIIGSAALLVAGVAVFLLVDRSDGGSISDVCGLGTPCP